jgi:Papain family cysteine protease
MVVRKSTRSARRSTRKAAASRRSVPRQPKTPRTARGHKLNALPDTLDFRDRMYVPTLVEVPTRIALAEHRRLKVPTLDQGQEGACTGFGLATVANYLLRRRRIVPDTVDVSPRMLYLMAKRYDEWPGEDYDGSSARGAMKGWHKHGVCSERCWRYDESSQEPAPFADRWSDAARRPLGAYLRVNHTDLVALHSAISEVGILYATANVHSGWDAVGSDGLIAQTKKITGGHAFAVVAYDERGFWIQNSWGTDWGFHGYCQITYDDWLANATDTWVARLGAPVVLTSVESTATAVSGTAAGSRSYVFSDLRPHIISLGNDGQPRTDGTFGTSASDIAAIFDTDFPRLTADWKKKFGKRRLLLYAHGGLASEDAAIQMVADDREALLGTGVYPISFLWQTDYLSVLKDILEDALRHRRPEGVLDSSKDFMLDRLDDALEPLARVLSGRLEWTQMKQNAVSATVSQTGGARVAATEIAALMDADPTLEVHLVAHSAGAVLFGPLCRLLTARGAINDGVLAGSAGLAHTISSCTLWAPACTISFFETMFKPAIDARLLRRFSLFTLSDKAEQDDDCVGIYHKSLLYLISNAFEDRPRIPLVRDGEPLLGMATFVRQDASLVSLLGANWVVTPNTQEPPNGSAARRHVDFHSDPATLQSTLARILADSSGKAAARARVLPMRRHAAASTLRQRRQLVEAAARR